MSKTFKVLLASLLLVLLLPAQLLVKGFWQVDLPLLVQQGVVMKHRILHYKG